MKKYIFPEIDIYELRLSSQVLYDESYIDGDEGDDRDFPGEE